MLPVNLLNDYCLDLHIHHVYMHKCEQQQHRNVR
jgi:hypothetical protein